MPTEIEGMQFTGFARLDLENLMKLDYSGRVKWLRYRFEFVFLTPFRRFVQLDSADCYVWLCVVSLLCTAVEALADFEFGGRGVERFARFVETYFRPDFSAGVLSLDDPKPKRGALATTPAQHLYKYFRCGLAHSFCIEWGGVLHREDGAPNYLFERNPVGAQKSLGVAPRELVADFLAAVEKFFDAAESWKPGMPQAVHFGRHFHEIFLVSCATPEP
jgi:hypothetical protein